MVLHTPPLGWNSWNTFGPDINEEVVLRSADALVETGLRDCGYDYLVIDDCWSKRVRGEDGRLEADPVKFPHGMKYVADYVHGKGLKFGMYSCSGQLTCGQYPGSFDHEFVDAATFAEWGVDYLKYDFCFHPVSRDPANLYRRMGLALANCGRDIVFSGCSWGAEKTKEWMHTTGTHLWRSTGDINDSWASVKSLSLSQIPDQVYGRVNCYNDMDMLIVGMNGAGNVALTGCTTEEYRLHFSLWAMLASPLMIGCDISKMDEAARGILTNRDVLAIDQDRAGRGAFVVGLGNWDAPIMEAVTLARYLENGDVALGMFNFEDKARTMTASAEDVGIDRNSGKTLELHDLWSGEVTPFNNEILNLPVEAHSCRMWRARVVDR